MNSKDQTKTKKIVNNILSLLDLQTDQIQVSFFDNSIKIQLNIPEDQSGIFIGHRGDTLNSLQLLLSLVIGQRLGSWHHLHINIGDYQERRLQTLLDKADQAADQASSTLQEIILPGLNSYERQLVHTHLSQRGDVLTESRGTPPYRQLFVIPKNN